VLAGFYSRLGDALATVVEAIPRGGVLIFLPSYSFLKACVKAWRSPSRYGASSHTQIWTRLESAKGTVVVEPTGSQAEFELAKKEYADCIRHSGQALLLAVYRGKMSEGISFNDDNARGVICVGIPFPSSFERSIVAKRAYNDEMRNLCGKQQLLPGKEWYSQQAYRAIAQALGRCVRHAGDYGTIILMDSRHCDDGAPVSDGVCRAHRNLPRWMRGHVRNLSMYGPRPVLNHANPPIFHGYRGLTTELESFFASAQEYSQVVLDGFEKDLAKALARSAVSSSSDLLFDTTTGTWSQSQLD
jgi:Fanconi anemia group J protein